MKHEQITELTTVLLTTGDTDKAVRSKIPEFAIEAMAGLVREGGGVLGSSRLAGLILEVRKDGPEGCAFINFTSPVGVPCVLSGAVWDQEQSDTMWAFLLEAARDSMKVAEVLRQPAVPWIGIVMYPMSADFTERELTMLGSVSRAVVFAILKDAGR